MTIIEKLRNVEPSLCRDLYRYLSINGVDKTLALLNDAIEENITDINQDDFNLDGLDLTAIENSLEEEAIELKRKASEDRVTDEDFVEFARIERVSINDAREASMQRQLHDMEDRRFLPILSIFSIVIAFAYITAVTFLEVGPDKRDLVNLVTGSILGVIILGVYTYWFGSSMGSKLKDK